MSVKQLITVRGEVLLSRTLRYFPGAMVVISDNEHKDKFIRLAKNTMILESTGSLIESLINTYKHWSDWNVILLGDVYYSIHTIKQIMDCQDELMFFGNSKEIYALVFRDKEKMLQACRETLAKGGKKLWHLYRLIQGIDILEHRICENFTKTQDTIDFDCYLQYEEYLRCHRRNR